VIPSERLTVERDSSLEDGADPGQRECAGKSFEEVESFDKKVNCMKLYVGNLNYATGEGELRELFGEFGEVASVAVITDRESGRSKGFGFVEFTNEDDAKAAISALDGKEIDGRALKVNEARPRNESGGGGGGGGRGQSRW
jgi:cold-inducible RNA-binding protein